MKVGILGGTFDPIHLGHLLMAEIAREVLGLQRVLFVPAGDPPHKRSRQKTPVHHRCAMVKLAIAGNLHFKLCLVDLERPGPHYSIDTIRLIQARFNLSAEQCFFIIGSDSVMDLSAWHNVQKFTSLCRLAVVHRPGYQPDVAALKRAIPEIGSRLNWIEIPAMGLAASEIRARVQAGQSIQYQVVDRVWEYIRQHRLYQTGNL